MATVLTWGVFVLANTMVPAGAWDQTSRLLDRWGRWDFIHFRDIALFGYLPGAGEAATAAPLYAFFPGMPALLRAGNGFGLDLVAVGLAVSFLSGAIAVIYLARLAEFEMPGLGVRAAMVFAFAPPAIFLFAPYTESLFLAVALPAWYYARKGNWLIASLFAALSCTIRISGAFLVVALFVQWIAQYLEQRGTKDLGVRRVRFGTLFWLAIPTAVMTAWMAYLWRITGDILAFQTAQVYWGRHTAFPWDALAATLNDYPPSNNGWMILAEVLAIGLGGILTILLLIKRRWGEATWIGINVALLGTSSYFYSVPRAALLWWPLWIGVAFVLRKSKILFALYLVLSAGAMVAWALLFWAGEWAG